MTRAAVGTSPPDLFASIVLVRSVQSRDVPASQMGWPSHPLRSGSQLALLQGGGANGDGQTIRQKGNETQGAHPGTGIGDHAPRGAGGRQSRVVAYPAGASA